MSFCRAMLCCATRFCCQVLYTTQDTATLKYKPHKLKGEEVAVVDQVGGLGGLGLSGIRGLLRSTHAAGQGG